MHNQNAADPAAPFFTRVYNALFRVFGPAQLGDPAEPPPPPAPGAAPCPRCGRQMSAHTYVETPERKRLRCPS